MTDKPGGYRDKVLWAVVILSVILKLTIVVEFKWAPPKKDENAYLRLADTLAKQERYVEIFRPPLYPAYLALMLAIGWDKMGAWGGQVLLGTVGVVLVYRIARRTLNRRAARIASGLFAFDPLLVWFTHRLWSETLFIFFLLAALDLLTSAWARRRAWAWLPAGLLFGLAGLTRPMILTFVPLLLPWAILQMYRARSSQTKPREPAVPAKRPKPAKRTKPTRKSKRTQPRPSQPDRPATNRPWLIGVWHEPASILEPSTSTTQIRQAPIGVNSDR